MNGQQRAVLRRAFVVLLVGTFVLFAGAGVATAQSGVGGAVVVEEGETVPEVNAVAGTVVIHGTVTGDVNGAAGTVLISGTVGGDVNVAAGNLQISGDVAGDVSAGAGTVHLEDTGTVGGNFDVGAGDVSIDGAITGDARIGAETIRLGENASIGGSLTYDGTLEGNRNAVAGDITHDRSLGATSVSDVQPLASWIFAVYAFLANVVLGIFLLALFPQFSRDVGSQTLAEPLKTGLIGLGTLVSMPLLLLVLVVSILGIPLALVGLFAFLFVIWVGVVYGRFLLGLWILSLFHRGRGERDRTWAALLLGLFLGAIIVRIPVAGDLVNALLLLLGLGALTLGVYTRRWGAKDSSAGSSETV